MIETQWEALMGHQLSSRKRNDYPVKEIRWDLAMAFCKKLTEQEQAIKKIPQGYEYRLPTEAEWEYACRAGCPDPFAKRLRDLGWYNNETLKEKEIHPVGQKHPNAWGLYDMHGNVAEWCLDWYGDYPLGPIIDPHGPGKRGKGRVCRGGSIDDILEDCRAASRKYTHIGSFPSNLGFRIVLAPIIVSLKPIKQDLSQNTWEIMLPNDVKISLLKCPAGTFIMGSPLDEKGRGTDEIQHQVTLSKPFWIGKTEVTKEQYVAWETAGNYPSYNPTYNQAKKDVTWSTAMGFCQELTKYERNAGLLPQGYEYRLPTEAEWEYACRSGGGDYAGLDVLDEMGWDEKNSGTKIHDVGQKHPNAWGLYDMHGNVAEWCLDWYGDYPLGPIIDPHGPSDGKFRIARGGNWNSVAEICRATSRNKFDPGNDNSRHGFRLVLAPIIPMPDSRDRVQMDTNLFTPRQ